MSGSGLGLVDAILRAIDALERNARFPDALRSNRFATITDRSLQMVVRVGFLLLILSLIVLLITLAWSVTLGTWSGGPRPVDPRTTKSDRGDETSLRLPDRRTIEAKLTDERNRNLQRERDNAAVEAERARCVARLDDRPAETVKRRFNAAKGDCDSGMIAAREERELCAQIALWCQRNFANAGRCDYTWSNQVATYCAGAYKAVPIDRSEELRLERKLRELR
jgi:hypothetical protein